MGEKRSPRIQPGEVFGRLTVLEYSHSADKRRWFRCVCECGTVVLAVSKRLRNGHTTSCGCRLREIRRDMGSITASAKSTHGQTTGGRTPTYRSWEAMRRRCLSPSSPDWDRYGGAGVTVCEEWASFAQFLADMGDRPPGHSLDRIDPFGNYEPTNCRWATAAVQRANRRASK